MLMNYYICTNIITIKQSRIDKLLNPTLDQGRNFELDYIKRQKQSLKTDELCFVVT